MVDYKILFGKSSMTTTILSLNTTLSSPLQPTASTYPKALFIDPVDALMLLPGVIANPKGNTLLANDFSQAVFAMRKLRNWVDGFLKQGGFVMSIMRPYHFFQHEKQPDLKIGNYDWLWEGAGDDARLTLLPCRAEALEVTDYGADSPLGEYLQKAEIMTDVAAQGSFYTLAFEKFRKSLALFFFQNQGKVVLVPRLKHMSNKKLLFQTIEESLSEENWPHRDLLKEMKPVWVNDYSLPEAQILEEVLAKKEDEISFLEQECEEIHERLCHFTQLRNALFCCNVSTMGNGIASILVQWGLDVYPKGQVIELISGKRHGIFLPVVCKKEAQLWWGKKLQRLLPPYHKGILVVNAYCHDHPRKRPHSLCSAALLEFAQQNHFAILNITDILHAHQQGNKNLMEEIWDLSGMYEKNKST